MDEILVALFAPEELVARVLRVVRRTEQARRFCLVARELAGHPGSLVHSMIFAHLRPRRPAEEVLRG